MNNFSDSETTFMYSNECSFNIISNVYGLSSILFNIEDSDIIGIGASAMQPTCAMEDGILLYNDKHDIVPPSTDGTLSYKLVMYREPDNMENLRIDFHKLDPSSTDPWQTMINLDEKKEPDDATTSSMAFTYLKALESSKNIPSLVCIGKPNIEYPNDEEIYTGLLTFRDTTSTSSEVATTPSQNQ